MPLRKPENTHLPKNMVVRRRGKRTYYYLQMRRRNEDHREVSLGSDLKTALEKYEVLHRHTRYHIPPPQDHQKWLMMLVRKNARLKKIKNELVADDIARMLRESGNKCQLTGIPFDMSVRGMKRIRPWVPSVDRIDPTGHYEVNNVRLVCAAANLAINQFGDEVFARIADGFIRMQRKNCGTDCGTIENGAKQQNEKSPEKPELRMAGGPGFEPGLTESESGVFYPLKQQHSPVSVPQSSDRSRL